MKRLGLIVLMTLILSVSASVTSGQDDVCSTVVQQALTSVQDTCGATARNQACYGNFSLAVTPREGVTELTFDQQGDVADVVDIQTLTLDEFNADDNTWGIALMKLQANLPDTLPGQNVTFLLFGDVELENGVDPENPDGLAPMQAFYLRSGIGETSCTEVPQSGVLIQTPQGAGNIVLRANDVDLELGSTAFIKAQAGESMSFSVLEGHGVATADGESVQVPAGSWVEIPVDEDLNASGAPSQPMPYNDDALNNLPIQLLPEQITITPSLTEEEIAELTQGNAAARGESDIGFGGFDPSMFEGFDSVTFCLIMGQVFSQSGMSQQEYISLIEQYRSFMDSETQAQMDEFLTMLNACK